MTAEAQGDDCPGCGESLGDMSLAIEASSCGFWLLNELIEYGRRGGFDPQVFATTVLATVIEALPEDGKILFESARESIRSRKRHAAHVLAAKDA